MDEIHYSCKLWDQERINFNNEFDKLKYMNKSILASRSALQNLLYIHKCSAESPSYIQECPAESPITFRSVLQSPPLHTGVPNRIPLTSKSESPLMSRTVLQSPPLHPGVLNRDPFTFLTAEQQYSSQEVGQLWVEEVHSCKFWGEAKSLLFSLIHYINMN